MEKEDYLWRNYQGLVQGEKILMYRENASKYERGSFAELKLESVKAVILRQYTDEELESLIKLEEPDLKKKLIDKIVEDYASEVHYNHCPNCGSLARPPQARQCPSCLHRWD